MKGQKRERQNGHSFGGRVLSLLLCAFLLASTAACGKTTAPSASRDEETESEDAGEKGKKKTKTDAADEKAGAGTAETAFARPVLFASENALFDEEQIQARVPFYTIDPDLGNVINAELLWIPDEWKGQLSTDGFYVADNYGREFFEIYESNRYMQAPSFVTVDSLMHTYHLYFAYLMKNIERGELYDRLVSLTGHMLEQSLAQRNEMMLSSQMTHLTESMQTAADRNIAFFAVARALLDPDWKPEDEEGIDAEGHVGKMIREELALINAAQGIDVSPLTGEAAEFEDYSQYKPRGYYDTDEKLSRYFRAMMWYGRRNFTQKNESLDMSAFLMTLAMDDEAFTDWSAIYAVTSFFAGASDDSGVCEYQPLIRQAYGAEPADVKLAAAVSDEESWRRFHELTESLDPPAINSVPMWDDQGETDKAAENKGFRLMGQRFTIDAAIFQKLIYSAVKENPQGDRRMLPDALDVPAALGNDTAKSILRDDLGAMGYQYYEDNLSKLRDSIQQAPDGLWTASLYAGWLNTLRPLLRDKGEGYPFFMQSEKWKRRDLESFLGSYTELKHDTVLYSKQVMAEMGGGEEEDHDDRGYVEPEPVVFARFRVLAEGTAEGLRRFGMLHADAERDLARLSEIAQSLEKIARKELADELPTDEEFELIRIYGGEIEHFWQEAYQEDAEALGMERPFSEEFPAALVVDVATDPNGSVLQLANDNPAMIAVVVPVDRKLRIARGSVYSFYQFVQPINDRMTDHEWHVMLGLDPDDTGEYHWQREGVPDKPAWTMDYRVSYDYD
ncbi:MAG: DUF3160 domain-containing protein [Lachnospiraceae bacterium]|nr:DUF3160 domain-containing protein [Lachnospiraceae bacterium]